MNLVLGVTMVLEATIAIALGMPLVVNNGGFETPGGLSTGGYSSGFTVPGWTEYEPSATPTNNYLWEWTVYCPKTNDLSARAIEGTNVLLGTAYNPSTAYIEQALPYTLRNKCVYTLSGWVADPDGHTPQNGARFFLYAGTNLLAVVTNIPGAAKTWRQASLNYSSGTNNPFAGQPLKIRVMQRSGNSYRVLIDGVSLDEEVVYAQPLAPTNLTVRLFGVATVDLDWDGDGDDVMGYRVERSLGGGGYTVIGHTPTEATFYRDSCLPAATVCSFRVVATNVQYSATSATVTITTAATPAGTVAGEVFGNVADYGFMFWSNGPASSHYAIKTRRYGMIFDWQSLKPTALFPISNPGSEASVLSESWTESFPGTPLVGFSCQVTADGTTNKVTSTGKSGDVQLVEGGKFFQRRWQLIRAGGLGLNSHLSGLEMASWPDRISFVLRLVPTNTLTNGKLQMTLELPGTYTNIMSSGPVFALADIKGSGFAVLKSADSSTISIDAPNSKIVVATQVSNWTSNQEHSVGLIIYPAGGDIAGVMGRAVVSETAPLPMSAVGIVPAIGALAVTYDADRGWHDVVLSSKGTTGADGILRTRLDLTNNTPGPRVLRFNFDGVPFNIPGISAVLRDRNLNPVGIPVQLSKNWHSTGSSDLRKFKGYWFHGLTMLTVPANATLSCELTMVGQNWGGKPAATHSQLSVIGYNDNCNQQWDEAALGNYGETFCYDAEHSLTDNDCTDSRAILMLDTSSRTGQWCGNHGGAQFLRYYDMGGTQRRHSRMRTRYVRYCPNLAEVIFAGGTDDGAMEFSYSAGLYRSDDYSRGIHRLRVEVKSDFSFSRLVFYQQAADTYAYGNGSLLAYGNATNPVPLRQWTATGGQNQNIGTPVALTGPIPWAMTINCTTPAPYTPANRGFVIRSWRARLNGVDSIPPYLVERSTPSTSIFDLVPPPALTALKAGDYVEAEIVRFYVPRYAKDYYGLNANLTRALTNYQGTYQMALREAVGNNLTVAPHWGTLEKSYPIQIEATNNRAGFTITGGLGLVPVTVSGLSDYRAPVLEEKVSNGWVAVNQTTHGNDFWQTDFNAQRGTWEVTYNLNLDGTNYADLATLMNSPPVRTFRFYTGIPQAPGLTVISALPQGQVQLTATGEPGAGFVLLQSPTLQQPLAGWTSVTNGSIDINPLTLFDFITPGATQRFYRLSTEE
jgi:hypothetical protein